MVDGLWLMTQSTLHLSVSKGTHAGDVRRSHPVLGRAGSASALQRAGRRSADVHVVQANETL